MNEKYVKRSITSRDSRDLNRIGDRIYWARKILGLTQQKIVDETGIPLSSYNGREAGVRSIYYEDYLMIARFFDSVWKRKFKRDYPEYNGNVIRSIKVVWILFGIEE